MSLSDQTTTKIANALKGEVIEYIYQHERYAEFMQDMIVSAINEKMGEMDDELLFDLSMLIFDQIELK